MIKVLKQRNCLLSIVKREVIVKNSSYTLPNSFIITVGMFDFGLILQHCRGSGATLPSESNQGQVK